MRKLVTVALFAGLALMMAGGFVFAQDAAAGKAVYAKKCQSCHAADGNGNATMAKALKVDIKPLSSDEVQNKTDADLKKVVTDGTGKMKPVTGLMPAELTNILAYLRSLKKK